ncbi:FAD-dependent oxidoreductase [Chitinophaga agrisoli]|uniref:FAD-dependent oxidoreductase n=1 Tax=Chitinophaga agrisoli TaxID=2607653 RepID=A0A5B2VZ26_9BACT|nr:FAD-dependent monooxygenase [Chitinophaga agrisoli]KAA2243269.1 FAD-dependent oxidoreductase [Chitinophaga agrisoli]
MKTNTVLISGASIAGPALAYWLQKYGYKVTIIERAPGIRPGGHAVDFRGAVMPLLKEMGVDEEIRRRQTRAGKITIVDKDNRKKASFPDGFTSGELEIMRGDLANVLYDATRHEAEYIFDDTITSLTEHNDGVEVSFQRNKPRRFDLVFGADGMHSRVRSIAFGTEASYIKHMGLYIAIFTVPNFMDQGMDGVYYGVPGKRVGIFGADNGKEARASFYFTEDSLEYDYRDIEQQKRIIRERFSGEAWEVPYLLEQMDKAHDFYFDSIGQIKMDRWYKGRIALLGDAAHCASPMSGMGTSMATIGAYILAGELMEADGDHEKAFASYDAQMREFVLRCQGLADGVDWFVPKTKFRQWMSNQLWKILPYTPWKDMMVTLPLKVASSIKLKEYRQPMPTALHATV